MLPVHHGAGVQRLSMNTQEVTASKTTLVVKVPGPLTPEHCSACQWPGPAGECLEPVLKSGRCGDYVFSVVNGKQRRRRWAKPIDPKTPAQKRSRARLAAASKEYNAALTQEQQDACVAAGAKEPCRPRLGDSGTLTGQQHWVRKRCKGKAEVPAPKTGTPKP